ncbi:Bacterial lipid A biosynthesis acyltransferase, partial [mine drainage metagenome]
ESYLLALRGYFSYSRYWFEALGLVQLSRRELSARMSFHGFENLFKALGEGKGVILTSPHLGNWDFGAAWLASGGHPITAVMEELKPRALFDWFSSHRIAFGVKVIPASVSAFGELAKTLARNEVAALVADRDILGSGVKVPVFRGGGFGATRCRAPVASNWGTNSSRGHLYVA